jgi:glycosyltransferase involved in cell wall biosynthesis
VGSKGWKSKKIFQTAENSSFSDQIHFIGYIAEEHKPFFYHLAELFVFPSFYEGFGLPVLEAQACALPVIAGLNSSFPEILKNSALLVNPDNLTEIAQGFTQILTQQDFKQALISKGLENVERFSWQKCAQETLNYLLAE